ncbi:hypothetical protein ACJX0J_013004, partial [Zea mays]
FFPIHSVDEEMLRWDSDVVLLRKLSLQQTNSKHVTWSLKEKIGDRYKENWGQVQLPVIILLTVQVAIEVVEGYEVRTQNLAANKYKGEGMGQENSSVLKKVQIYIILTVIVNYCATEWLPKNPVMKFKNTSYDRFNVWSLNYNLLGLGFFFSFARISLVQALQNQINLILLTFFVSQSYWKQLRSKNFGKHEKGTKTSSVRPALEPDIDLEELEVHYSSFLLLLCVEIMKTFFCLFSRQDWVRTGTLIQQRIYAAVDGKWNVR